MDHKFNTSPESVCITTKQHRKQHKKTRQESNNQFIIMIIGKLKEAQNKQLLIKL